jgi:intracellular sulfur oxidation DsrE/DsrF family protein
MVFVRHLLFGLVAAFTAGGAEAAARVVDTPYGAQKVVFDFYLDDPGKMATALFWVRSLVNPLMGSPYDYPPEALRVVVVIHGTEIVTLARKNYARYKDVVERMRYYAGLGVKFKVCGIAAHDYGYRPADFYDFVDVVPSAFAELAHWQMQGYGLIIPRVPERKFTTDEIR